MRPVRSLRGEGCCSWSRGKFFVLVLYIAWVVLHRNRHIGASERRQLRPHVRYSCTCSCCFLKIFLMYLYILAQVHKAFLCCSFLFSSPPTHSFDLYPITGWLISPVLLLVGFVSLLTMEDPWCFCCLWR